MDRGGGRKRRRWIEAVLDRGDVRGAARRGDARRRRQ